ncbi:MAG: hypothetical protein ACKVPJ_06810 [Chitinophagales bacterium]
METVVKHISKLLFDHNCVIVPGLGGFVANYQSAKMHPVSYIFNSPAKSLAFNINLKHNDGLLQYQLVAEEHISPLEAEIQIKNFVDDVQITLAKNQIYKLQHIGRLMHDIEGNPQFVPDATENYLQEAFGLYNFTADPITRKGTVIKHIEPGHLKPVPEKKQKVKRWIPVAASILLALIGLQIFLQSGKKGYNLSELMDLQGLFSKKEFIARQVVQPNLQLNKTFIQNYRPVEIPIIDSTLLVDTIQIEKLIPKPVQEEVILTSQSSTYSIIAGVYGKIEYAEVIISELREKNFQPEIISKNGNYMIALAIPVNENLVKYRQSFADASGISDAWVMKNK